MEVQNGQGHQTEKDKRTEKGRDHGGRHLATEALNHVAHLVPLHMRVPVPAYESNPDRSPFGREEQGRHYKVEHDQKQ